MPPRKAPSAAARTRSTARADLARAQRLAGDPDALLPEGQQAKERVDGRLYVAIAGRDFMLAEKTGLMPLMLWVAASDRFSAQQNASLSGLFRVLEDTVDESEMEDFVKHTTDSKCGIDDFVQFINAATEALAARPTGEPATS